MEKLSVRTQRGITPFNRFNYSIWIKRVRLLLKEHHILSIIDKEIPEVPKEKWVQKNDVAHSIIGSLLADSLLHFTDVAYAKNIFEKLDAVYDRKSLPTRMIMRKRLSDLKLAAEMSLMEHFSIFDTYVNDLSASGLKVDEVDKVLHLLSTLPSLYDGIITAIETLSEDKLNLDLVKS